jgi:hypothetical protein
MTTYSVHELMLKTNHHLIKGGELTDAHKKNIVGQLLAARSTPNVKRWGSMYPLFYIPPDRNKKKYQTVIPMSPKTEILSQNSYELEIIRLLHLFDGQHDDVCHMKEETLKRLKKTCFGYEGCSTGECFESGLVTLRFLSAVSPTQREWIGKQISVFNGCYFNKKRHSGVLRYFWLCLSEMPFDIAEPEIRRYKDTVLSLKTRKSKNDTDDGSLVLECATQNTLMLVE